MLQVELFRRRYAATKVTTKMLHAVDFHSRPLDHFLSSAGANLATQRMVGPDATQWSGSEPTPASTIRTPEHLHSALYAITDAASVWYPDDLARVFRAVYINAIQTVRSGAPDPLLNATVNLYSAVFAAVFNDILAGMPLHDLEGQALHMLHRDSTAYQHYVGRVLNDAMMLSIFRGPHGHPRDPPPPRLQHERRAPRQPPGGQVPRQPPGGQTTVIPKHLRAQIPRVNGSDLVCLRFQTMKDCDFPKCRHAHEFANLPQPVLDWLIEHHGSLKSDHPQW